jgi:DNA-binding MarR family transcriptional regulator
MIVRDATRALLNGFPKIFHACHRRHRRDPRERSGSSLSAHQASVLDHLDATEPLTLRELAAHMGVTASTMSLTIDRLERGGYVRRSRDAEDARRVNLRLTAAGARIKRQQKVLEPDCVAAMLQRLTAAERQSAIEGFALLARAAEELINERTGGDAAEEAEE